MQETFTPRASPADPALLVAELLERDRWSRAEMDRYQAERLQALLAHAARSSPYYRSALGKNGMAGAPLSELPTLSKPTLIAEFDRIVTVPGLRRREIEAHLKTRRAAQPLASGHHVFRGSGSSGLPALFVQSAEEFATSVAGALRVFIQNGVTPGARLMVIAAPYPLHATRRIAMALRPPACDLPALDVLTPIDEMADALNTAQPEAIATFSGIAALLASAQLDGKLQISPRAIFTTAEVLTPAMRTQIREAWGLGATDIYGCTEATCVAASFPGESGLKVYRDHCIVEVVDAENHPVPPGTPGAKVLLTNLFNYTQPLIRYELTDSVISAESSRDDRCRRIASVDGRSDDILRFRAPGGASIDVHPYTLRLPFAQQPEVSQYQILQTCDGLEVQLVLRPAAPDDTPARACAALTGALASAGAIVPKVTPFVVSTLRRDEKAGAKLKLVRKLDATRGS